MKRRDVILLTLAVCLFGGAAVVTWRAVRSNRQAGDLAQGTFWICQDCQHEFAASVDEVLKGDLACPKCGKQNVARGIRCPNCQHIFVREGRGQPVCPQCKQALPTLFEGRPG